MMMLLGGMLETTIVINIFVHCHRKRTARTRAEQILMLGMTGDKSAVPTRVPTVRRGTRESAAQKVYAEDIATRYITLNALVPLELT
jgi:hypothetical protein